MSKAGLLGKIPLRLLSCLQMHRSNALKTRGRQQDGGSSGRGTRVYRWRIHVDVWQDEVNVKSLSRVRLFATLWTVAHQAPPSMGFSRQEYWSGVPYNIVK